MVMWSEYWTQEDIWRWLEQCAIRKLTQAGESRLRGAISKLVCPKTKLQSPSNRSLAPLHSGSFAPFRLKVVSDAARSRRYEIGLR
jgi:hypothetical protein